MKTEQTLDLERKIWQATLGRERLDVLKLRLVGLATSG